MLGASDDPMIPVGSLTRWPVSPTVRRELPATGGHVGFVCLCRAPGWFWAAERVMSFLDGVAS